MIKKNWLKVVTLILMIVIVICSAKLSFAVTSIPTTGGNNTPTNRATNNVPSGSSSNNALGANTPSNGSANGSLNMQQPPVSNNNSVQGNKPTTTNGTIPETGAESVLPLIIMGSLATVSAVYTYSKVKRYNF